MDPTVELVVVGCSDVWNGPLPSEVTPEPLPVGPRCELKYSRDPDGSNAGPPQLGTALVQ